MFLHTAPDVVLALDATTGQQLWRPCLQAGQWLVDEDGPRPWRRACFAPTSDLHVIALDAHTGEQAWDHKIELSQPATNRSVFNLRSAPLVVGNKVIQGVTASAGPGGGFIVALDIETGKELWRFHTLARPGEPGGNTWNDIALDKRTGGSVWHQGTYDPELNLIDHGAGQPTTPPSFVTPRRFPGVTNDALFTNATIALDADTGKLKWYYQHLSNDQLGPRLGIRADAGDSQSWRQDPQGRDECRQDGDTRGPRSRHRRLSVLDRRRHAERHHGHRSEDRREDDRSAAPSRSCALDGLLPKPVGLARLADDILQSVDGSALPAADRVVREDGNGGLAAPERRRGQDL